jgi:hypothetical protein
MIEQHHGTPALPGLQGTHHASRAGADNNHICFHICSITFINSSFRRITSDFAGVFCQLSRMAMRRNDEIPCFS